MPNVIVNWNSNHTNLQYIKLRPNEILQFAGMYLISLVFDNDCLTVDHIELTVIVEIPDIAAPKPTIFVDSTLRGSFIIQISLRLLIIVIRNLKCVFKFGSYQEWTTSFQAYFSRVSWAQGISVDVYDLVVRDP